jgi:hypothetical protein
MKLKVFIEKFQKTETVLFAFFFLLSWMLMWKTFRVTPDGNMQIASKAWSDFAATIPLIRSFSLGSNFPPQYPIFAGPPIRYHFVFYFLVGILEKIGLPISWALNIPSVLGFFILLIMIYTVSKYIFKSRAVGFLSSFFFLFNGSFSFLEFFRIHPLSLKTISEIIKSNNFASFGPYDGKAISAFWNLNIFTNQRHLALGYAFFLFLVLYFYRRSKQKRESLNLYRTISLGIIVGIFPFIHFAVFGMAEILLGVLFIFYPKVRKETFIIGLTSVLVAVPQALYMGKSEVNTNLIHPGYLIQNLTVFNFIKYWFLNIGLALILGPIGFVLANKEQRKIFLPFLALFVIGNLFQFSPEIAANHKFFNLSVIGLNMFASYALIKMWKWKTQAKPLVIIASFFMVLSGILDIFPIFNDSYITIQDIPNNKAASYIKNSTPKDAVFLNSSFLYHPASLAGRKIFTGWPYFAWSAGYNTDQRGKVLNAIYSSSSKQITCKLLKENNIDYFTIQDTYGDPNYPPINLSYFSQNFQSDYSDQYLQIINVSKNCPN